MSLCCSYCCCCAVVAAVPDVAAAVACDVCIRNSRAHADEFIVCACDRIKIRSISRVRMRAGSAFAREDNIFSCGRLSYSYANTQPAIRPELRAIRQPVPPSQAFTNTQTQEDTCPLRSPSSASSSSCCERCSAITRCPSHEH